MLISALDPAFIGWVSHPDRFDANDGQYTEVIHTNYGINGYLADLGHVDFYPNGGISMPGCDSHACDHARSYFYFAESITSGGFTGRQCLNYYAAILSSCDLLPGRLEMGGLRPKIGWVFKVSNGHRLKIIYKEKFFNLCFSFQENWCVLLGNKRLSSIFPRLIETTNNPQHYFITITSQLHHKV